MNLKAGNRGVCLGGHAQRIAAVIASATAQFATELPAHEGNERTSIAAPQCRQMKHGLACSTSALLSSACDVAAGPVCSSSRTRAKTCALIRAACSPKNCSRPLRCACSSCSRKRRRKRRDSTRTQSNNAGLQAIQRLAGEPDRVVTQVFLPSHPLNAQDRWYLAPGRPITTRVVDEPDSMYGLRSCVAVLVRGK